MAKNRGATAPAAQSSPAPSSGGGDATRAALRKQFGAGSIISGSDKLEKPEEKISLSPKFDAALGGGLLVGSLNTFSGPSGCGKTTTILQAAASWQQAGGVVWYLNAESKLLCRDLTGIAGLDVPAIQIVESHEGHILTAQDYLQIGENVLKNEKRAMLIIDSFSILSAAAEMENTTYEGVPPGGSGRLVGAFCRKMAPIIPINGNIVMGIAQVYANIGGQTKWATALPNKAIYARTTGLKCTHIKPLDVGSGDNVKQIGQIVHWVVERSAFGPPGGEFTSRIRYGVGIDKVGELIEIATSLTLVQKNGAWYSFEHAGEMFKRQGEENFYGMLQDRPDLVQVLSDQVAELIA